MPAAPIACPKCHAALRPAKPVAAGAVIRCPKCDTQFRVGSAAAKPAAAEQPAAPGQADDFASFTQEEPVAARRYRRGACGPILVGCLLLLAPLLGAGGVLTYCFFAYWLPAAKSALPENPAAPKDKDKPQDQGAAKP